MSSPQPTRIVRRKGANQGPSTTSAAATPPVSAPASATRGRVITRRRSISPQRETTSAAPAANAATKPAPAAAAARSATSEKDKTSATRRASLNTATPQPQPAPVVVDRETLSAVNFSAPTFVNNVTGRLLNPLLAKHQSFQRLVELTGGDGASSAGSAAAAKLRSSDGGSLFGDGKAASNVRMANKEALSQELAATDYESLAGEVTTMLEGATEQISRLFLNEEASLRHQEVRSKRIEISTKRRLATVRLGLEATSARLQAYENRVGNAQATTAGIEQHLSQSNARVQRGKAVSQLLKFFRAFTAMEPRELASVLKSLSKTRESQRTAVTDRWAQGRVSAFNPRYFTTVVVTGNAATEGRDGDPSDAAGGVDIVTVKGKRSAVASSTTQRAGKRRVLRRRSQGDSNATSRRGSLAGSEAGGSGRDGEDGEGSGSDFFSSDSDSEDERVGVNGIVSAAIKLHRTESAAVAAGLDKLFALRSCTEAQVEWCQKLHLLASELGDLARNVGNIETYITWLRQELVSDLFHVMTCFNNFYDNDPQTAAHQTYGRATLKTMELISRLYSALTPSTDTLQAVFFSRSVNDLGVALFSEHSPRPLPGQPPLPNPAPVLAMDHFRKHTDQELGETFRFLADRVRRDVITVETIFGTTSTARQQLLSQVTDGVVKPFIVQQIKLAETHMTFLVNAEGGLSPRTKRRSATRVADAVAYYHTVKVRYFTFFQEYLKGLKSMFDEGEISFLAKFTDAIFPDRATYSSARTELELLQRYYTLLEESYTRKLHAIPGEFFDLREAHMTKTKEMIDYLMEVASRVKVYALPKAVGPYVFDLVNEALKTVGIFLDTELKKSFDSVRGDRDNWRLKPRTEEELLRPAKPEAQQCGFRMLLFAQSSLMSLSDCVTVITMPLVQGYPRLVQDIDEARTRQLDALDERSEKLLNMCLQAIVIRSLSILTHYQLKSDYVPKKSKDDDIYAVAPPCTRACTLFCYYVTRQFEEAKEFIRLSNGQVPQRQSASQIASGATLGNIVSQQSSQGYFSPPGASTLSSGGGGGGGVAALGQNAGTFTMMASPATAMISSRDAVRARARTMNLQQLLFGDGGPSSFVRTLGVCLYRGISAHLKTSVANDRGAMVYKQDVTAYKEAMTPLTSTPGVGGAVVETLFQMLKETSSLLIMPLDHIKEVKESGTLRLMGNEEKLRYIRVRQDVRDAFKIINS